MGKLNNLPSEIMLEILTRLPTETVLECKLVCKPWKDVVRHQSFAQLHLSRLRSAADEDSGKLGFIFHSLEGFSPEEFGKSRITHGFYYTEYDDETPFNGKTRMDLNPPEVEKCSFAGSCNGLICFKSWHNRTNYGPFYICNPVTRECIILPDTQGEYFLNGFGYCPSTNEYKVVRIRSQDQVVQVYTLGSGNGWRSVGNTHSIGKYFTLGAGAVANGALHWMDPIDKIILAFHLADEKCSKVPYPPCSMQSDDQYLGVLGEFLSVTCNGCEIWLLKKNKDNSELCWSKEFSFERYILARPFGITKNGMLLCYKNCKLFGYDKKASSAKLEASFSRPITEAIPHKNTLVSLQVLGEKDAKTMEFSESASEAMESLALEASV